MVSRGLLRRQCLRPGPDAPFIYLTRRKRGLLSVLQGKKYFLKNNAAKICANEIFFFYLCTRLTRKLVECNMVDVVQLVRASDCGSECRGFESHLPPSRFLATHESCKVFSFFPYLPLILRVPLFTLIFQLFTPFCNSVARVFPLILHRQSTNECTDLIIIKKNESQKE